uniref:Hexosyltransferase n=1 Tax=Eptatretus burgeri TaxID=7764 RepID=A0A8C4QN94_EPTBU
GFGSGPDLVQVWILVQIRIWFRSGFGSGPDLVQVWILVQVRILVQHFVAHRHCRYFPMLHNHPKKCGAVDGSKYVPYLLLVMKSTPAQAERREAIRRTWGREGLASGGRKIKRLFLLALPPDTPEGALQQKLVDYEDRVHGDILQWAFTDSFFNLTLKELNFLKWFHMFCPRVPFVFKGDDDVFVNTANVIDYLAFVRPGSDLFAGDVIEDAMPIRNPESKYYIPPPIFRPARYPPYAGGGGYLMSGVLTRRLHAAAKLVDNFPIDDVWLGMVLRRLNVIPLHHPGFRTFGIVRRRETPMNKDPCFYRGLLLVHKLMPPELLAILRVKWLLTSFFCRTSLG